MIIEKGIVIAGKYRLEAVLAKGGMGSIWVAGHVPLDTKVAIKFIDPSFAERADMLVRFEREAKTTALLHGPNVVQIHDYGAEDGVPFIVMELLAGQDLGARLAVVGRLPLPEVAQILNQVGRVLRKAQEAEIVHRDLKPSNIFLVQCEGDESPVLKVLDFGVAKAPTMRMSARSNRARTATLTGTVVGSPRYMSPEQARGLKTVDHRSDLWSLAVIAFRAATGKVPFPGNELAEVLVRICTEPPRRASKIAPDLPESIDRFFAKAFALDPDQRFQSAVELATAFALAADLPPPSVMSVSSPLPLGRRDAEAAVESSPKRLPQGEPLLLTTLATPSSSLAVERTRPSAEPPVALQKRAASRTTVHERIADAGPVAPTLEPPPEEGCVSSSGGPLTTTARVADVPSARSSRPAPRGPWGRPVLLGVAGITIAIHVFLRAALPAAPASTVGSQSLALADDTAEVGPAKPEPVSPIPSASVIPAMVALPLALPSAPRTAPANEPPAAATPPPARRRHKILGF
jgi:serine/threonine-protein kinase